MLIRRVDSVLFFAILGAFYVDRSIDYGIDGKLYFFFLTLRFKRGKKRGQGIYKLCIGLSIRIRIRIRI